MGIGSRNQPYGDFRCGIEKDRPCPSDKILVISDEKIKGVKKCKPHSSNLRTCELSCESLPDSQCDFAESLMNGQINRKFIIYFSNVIYLYLLFSFYFFQKKRARQTKVLPVVGKDLQSTMYLGGRKLSPDHTVYINIVPH